MATPTREAHTPSTLHADYSLLNKKLDPTSSFWKKKYTLLLKRAENVEKQNLRIINRLYHMKKILKRLSKERKFLMSRLDSHKDTYKNTKFFYNVEYLPEGSSEYELANPTDLLKVKQAAKKKNFQPSHDAPPKKPLNAYLRFCQARRDVVLKENPGISNQNLTKVLSKLWNTMDEEQKEVYYDMFDQDRLRYDLELEKYKKRKGGEGVSVNHVTTDNPLTASQASLENSEMPSNLSASDDVD